MLYCRQEAIKRQVDLGEFQNEYFHQAQNRSETDRMNRHCNRNLERGHPSPQSGWLTTGNASRTSNPFLLPLCHWRQRMDGRFSLLSWLPTPLPPTPYFPSSTLHCSLLFCLEGSLVSIRITISGQRDLSFPWESGSLSITTSKGKLSTNRQLCRHKRSSRMKQRTLIRLNWMQLMQTDCNTFLLLKLQPHWLLAKFSVANWVTF